ncbi:MAG: hypothetical protein LUQ17_04670 [Methanomicrobiales archaeon]|nr:hypothetical protein [Methanomicrobiales archaeon]
MNYACRQDVMSILLSCEKSLDEETPGIRCIQGKDYLLWRVSSQESGEASRASVG